MGVTFVDDDPNSSPLKGLDVLMKNMTASLDLKCIPTPENVRGLYHNTENVSSTIHLLFQFGSTKVI